MKTTLFALILGLGALDGTDLGHLIFKEGKKIELDQRETDFVRENLVHIFDCSNFHQMQGGALPVRTEEEIKEQIQKVKSGLHIELTLDESTRIVVENEALQMGKMWVSIRESDGFVYDWIFETPDGNLISLSEARGNWSSGLLLMSLTY